MNDNDIAQAVSNVLSKYTKTTPDVAPQAIPAVTQRQESDPLDALIAKALAHQADVVIPTEADVFPAKTAGNGAFATMDEAIAAAVIAQVQSVSYTHLTLPTILLV